MLNDLQIIVAKLASECSISNGSVYTKMHKHLKYLPGGYPQDCQQRVESSPELLEVYNANPEVFHTRLGFTTATILKSKFEQINHPPYSPDLAPSDFLSVSKCEVPLAWNEISGR